MTIIKVIVKFIVGKSYLEKISSGEYVAFLNELPEKGRANLEIVRLISREFGVSYKKIKIKNKLSREKLIEIDL